MEARERVLRILGQASWRLAPREMAVARFPREAAPAVLAALRPGADACPLWWGDDGFEVTVVAPLEALRGSALEAVPGARVEAGWALLTCLTPLPWDVVGFLAEVTARLAAAGITCGALSAFSRDHLLVPWSRREEALGLLAGPGGRAG